MLDTILKVFSEITFYFLLVTSFIFGISLAVNLLISNTFKKIRIESDKNYKQIPSEEIEKCDAIIKDVKEELSQLATQTKKNEKIRQNNKFLKFFVLKQKEEIVIEKSFKSILSKLLQEIFNVFKDKNDKSKKTYLSLSERDLFLIAITLKDRLNSLISSAKIIWLKRLPISVILYCLSFYNKAIKVKNKFFVALTLKLIGFFSWFIKIFSPESIWKEIIKNLSGETLEEGIVNSLIEIMAKELCVIYKDVCDKDKKLSI